MRRTNGRTRTHCITTHSRRARTRRDDLLFTIQSLRTKTDEGIAKQVPDRSASAGTGYWFRRVVVNGGGRQILRCAGDDLYGAVGGGRWSSGSRRSRCRCPSNNDADSVTCCRFLALTMWSCVRARGVHVTLYVMYIR